MTKKEEKKGGTRRGTKKLFTLASHPLEYSLGLPGGSSLPTHSLQMVIPSHTAQASPLLPSSLPPLQTDILQKD